MDKPILQQKGYILRAEWIGNVGGCGEIEIHPRCAVREAVPAHLAHFDEERREAGEELVLSVPRELLRTCPVGQEVMITISILGTHDDLAD